MIEYATILAGRTPERCDAAVRCEPLGENALALALADGVSCGRNSGNASRAAVGEIMPRLLDLSENKRRKHKAWEKLFRQVDRPVRRGRETGVCALVAMIVDGGVVCGASVGHEAVWILGPHTSEDITAKQRIEPLLGSGEVAATFFHATLPGPTSEDEHGKHGGGALVAMSSGLWRHVDQKHITEAALKHAPEQAAIRLEEVARWRFNGALAEDIAGAVVRR